MIVGGQEEYFRFGKPEPETVSFAAPSQVYVPVTAQGRSVLDNGGDLVCQCFTPELAQRIAELLNRDY